jgi:hypothetical protein
VTPGYVHLTVIGDPEVAACGGWPAHRLTQDMTQATCPQCRQSWAYAVAERRAALPVHWLPVSVEPAADFGSEHGLLAVSDAGDGQVLIEQADPFIYVPDEWVARAAAGEFPWAVIGHVNPWRQVLKIRGTDRTVIYEENGSCGPRVMATIFIWVD